MSFEPDNQEKANSLEENQSEIIKWLKVIAIILGDAQGMDPEEIYEDIE